MVLKVAWWCWVCMLQQVTKEKMKKKDSRNAFFCLTATSTPTVLIQWVWKAKEVHKWLLARVICSLCFMIEGYCCHLLVLLVIVDDNFNWIFPEKENHSWRKSGRRILNLGATNCNWIPFSSFKSLQGKSFLLTSCKYRFFILQMFDISSRYLSAFFFFQSSTRQPQRGSDMRVMIPFDFIW